MANFGKILMSRFSQLSLGFALLGVYGLTLIVGFNPSLQSAIAVERSSIPSDRRPTPRNFNSIPPAACWRLSYTLSGVTYQSQLNLKGNQGTLSTTLTSSVERPNLRQQLVNVSDVDRDGWIRRQLFLWLNRLQQRKATEQELTQISQQINRGNLTGTDLEAAKQFQQSLQALLTSSDPQAVVLTRLKAEAVQQFQQSQRQIESDAKQAERTLTQQIEQRQQQILSALRDPQQRKQLEDQLRQIDAAIASGQLRGDQLKQTQQAQRELRRLRANPNSVSERAREFQAQQLVGLRDSQKRALQQARGELSKQMLMIENNDNVLVMVTSNPDNSSSSNAVQPQAFSLQIRNNQYTAKTCNANGECAPVTIASCS